MPIEELMTLGEAAEVSVIALADRPGMRPTPSDGQPLLPARAVFSDIEANFEEEDEIRERASQPSSSCCDAIVACICCPCLCLIDCSTSWRSCCPRIHGCVCGAFSSLAGMASVILFYADVVSDALLAEELLRTNNPIVRTLALDHPGRASGWCCLDHVSLSLCVLTPTSLDRDSSL